ncbi:MAG: bifunctional hydroxymethylpyrimidine kinase/phosphomethylpyrimidine kinase [Nitrososphaerota archaeon]|nr:bifunctional hydroxymethylpyrimidine kinase/phosphomethylpyrimidine kinase [Nitrososphaerales archaeon]MDW8044878.1 bifunctional hydroxymethylpyrimidine kinase/phosphomethylpyrimidine kinase [Nitrososphaerota archaeon]
MNIKPIRALTIAGSDSGGGAGIQADLKTFAAFGVHGMSVITAITAQNTVSVSAIHDVPLDIIKAQIEAVVEDIGVDIVKTGMLHTKDVINLVADEVMEYRLPIVVDPVMVAKSGARLLREDAVNTLIERLLPLAIVVTPNRMEAEILANMNIGNLHDAEVAARRIAELGPQAVVVKGGHLSTEDKVVDTLYYKGEVKRYVGDRLDADTTHGTGCCFASAIAALLAKGFGVEEAVKIAKDFVYTSIKFGFHVGRGKGPVNPMAKLINDSEKYFVIKSIKEAIRVLEAHPEVKRLIPESQSNLVFALPYASSVEDVAAVPGRIVKWDGGVKASMPPEFGASSHVAKTVLTAMKHNPSIRAGMNIKYSEGLVEACKKIGLKVSYYDRRLEPPEVKSVEGMSTAWGAEQAIRSIGEVPDVIYHTGDYGKEPMITILGRTAMDVVKIVIKLAEIVEK